MFIEHMSFIHRCYIEAHVIAILLALAQQCKSVSSFRFADRKGGSKEPSDLHASATQTVEPMSPKVGGSGWSRGEGSLDGQGGGGARVTRTILLGKCLLTSAWNSSSSPLG